MLTDQRPGGGETDARLYEMSVYAVGDVQGFHGPLCRLLEQVRFDERADQLWLVGDLVNRGPESLEVLRLVRSLGPAARVVLGNHEIHLLAVAAGVRRLRARDTLQVILDAPDRGELIEWLTQQPLLHWDDRLDYCMVHAGIPPQWDLQEASERAREAERWLGPSHIASIVGTSSTEPLELTHDLVASQRARIIVSYFTRLRVCSAEGRLNLTFKGAAEDAPEGFLPWFAHPGRRTRNVRIIFGHWAALQGRADAPNVYALDTGCAWGRSLTLMRLEDQRRFSCDCG